MPTTSDLDLPAIRARLKAATPSKPPATMTMGEYAAYCDAREALADHTPADLAALLDEVERLRARLSTCEFCGLSVAEGAGGHASGCYETMLNKSSETIARLLAERDAARGREEELIERLDRVIDQRDEAYARGVEDERRAVVEDLTRLSLPYVAHRIGAGLHRQGGDRGQE